MLIKLNLFIVFSICITFSGYANGAFSFKKYEELINSYEFKKAVTLAKGCEDPILKNQLINLAEINYYEGYLVNDIKLNNSLKNNPKIINLLAIGYNKLFTKSVTSEPFSYFSEAYTLSFENKNVPLQKISLIAILQVFSSEINISNYEYKTYLDKYKQLIESPENEFLYEMFKLNFILKDTKLPKLSQSLFNPLDNLVNNLKPNHYYLPNYYSFKAVFFEYSNNFGLAEKYNNLAIEAIKEEPFLRNIKFRSYIHLAEISHKLKNPTNALKILDKAKKYRNSNDSIRANYYINLYASNYNYELKNYKEAYEKSKLAEKALLLLNLNDNSKDIAKLKVQYETAEKEKNLLLAEKEKEKNKNIAFALAGILLLGSTIAILLYKNTKRKQRIAEQEREIEIQKTEKILKEQELNTIDAMLAGQEKERQKLAEDLHDSVGATLAAAKLQFNHLDQNRDKLEAMDELFSKTGNLLDEAYSEIRAMAHLKNSGVIAKNGLLPALEKLAKNASSTNGLQVTIENFGLEQRFESAQEITIFRVIQELVTNIIKHANATEASISLTPHENELSIIIEDNGKGFNPREVKKQDGMGLSNIERRIEHLEGTMEVDSTPGRGTTILIDIPL